jgi:hypothetical protein
MTRFKLWLEKVKKRVEEMRVGSCFSLNLRYLRRKLSATFTSLKTSAAMLTQ